MGNIIGETMNASKSSVNDAAMVAMIADWLKPFATRSQVVVMANQADGVLMASNTSIPMNSSITAFTTTGVLAGIALPVLTRTKNKAVQVQEINTARMVMTGLQMYEVEHGKYPLELSELIREKMLNDEGLLYVTDPTTKERKPWLYNNKFSVSNPGTGVLFASPSLANGKRIVGFNDGSVKVISEDEFKALRN